MIDYAIDEDIAKQATMILDLLMLDFAHHSFEGRFVRDVGPMLRTQKKDSDNADVNDILQSCVSDSRRLRATDTRLSALF
ncbi:MAG: hypothetical protein MZU97_05885 [Bacillus subtilis]|nr:hypothetical protein [Bacillus subtilis]